MPPATRFPGCRSSGNPRRCCRSARFHSFRTPTESFSPLSPSGPTAGATQVQLRTVSTDSTPFGASNNIVTTLFSVTVGAATTPPPTPGLGQPATLRILSGDLQSGQPGAQLPVRLKARVEDSSGNPLPNVPVMWQSSQAVSLSNVSSTSDGSGIVSATATLGSITGPAQVQTAGGGGGADAVRPCQHHHPGKFQPVGGRRPYRESRAGRGRRNPAGGERK